MRLPIAQVPEWLVGVVNTRNLYWFALIVLVIVYLVVLWVDRSRLGTPRRGDAGERAACAVLGLRPYTAKLIVFVVAAGLRRSGRRRVHAPAIRDAPRAVGADLTITVLVMVVLGGVGFRWGAIVGGVLYTLLDQRLTVARAARSRSRTLPDVLRIPLSEPLFLLGVLFILVVMFLPGGIAGTVDAAIRRRRGERTRTAAAPARRHPRRGRAHPWRCARDRPGDGSGAGDGPHTVGRWLADRAAASPERTAIDDRGVTIGYATLDDRARELALAPARAGYGPGDRIATVSGNSTDHVVAFFACARAGIALVPLSWRLTPRELGDALARSDPALVLVEDEYAASPAEALRATRRPSARRAPRHDRGRGSRPRRDRARGARPATSRTTTPCSSSTRRAARPPRRASCSPTRTASGTISPSPEPCSSPPTTSCSRCCRSSTSRHGTAAAPRLVGRGDGRARALVPADPRPAAHRRARGDGHDGRSHAVPSARRRSAVRPPPRLPRLRIALVGGATMPPDLAAAWARARRPAHPGLRTHRGRAQRPHLPAGGGAASSRRRRPPLPARRRLRRRPRDSCCPWRERRRGSCGCGARASSRGYLHDDAATARARHGEWLRTGDLVRRDADGVFTIVDRLKDIYISGGENVAPAEVERALRLHPLIVDAAVVGVPDPVWGERGVAFVVRRPGAALVARTRCSRMRGRARGDSRSPCASGSSTSCPARPSRRSPARALRESAAALIEEDAHERR